MLMSREKKFIFVHIQKTAGQSIRDDLFAQVKDLEVLAGKHDGALVGMKSLGAEAWREYFTFAFVRNPWDRLVSWYSMIDAHRPRNALAALIPNKQRRLKLWRYVLTNARNFDEFVERCTDTIQDVDGEKSFTKNQVEYLTDETGALVVSFIGKMERVKDDYGEIRRRIGMDDRPLPHLRHKSRHDHYSVYYSDRSRDLVAQRFKRDIEQFGYEFEDRRGSKVSA